MASTRYPLLLSLIVEVCAGHAGKHLALIRASAARSGRQHDMVLFAGLLAAAVGAGFASRAAYSGMLRETNIRVEVQQ